MRLTDLLREAGLADRSSPGWPARDVDISGIAYSSREAGHGDLFFALPGHQTHGAHYAAQAVQFGAVAVVTDPVGAGIIADSLPNSGVPIVEVVEPRRSMAFVARAFYGDPASQLAMLGVTGTNGKTSVTYLLRAALQSVGVPCGVVGTIGARLPDGTPIEQARTTPESPDLQQVLAHMRDAGASTVAMEVSSIAVQEGRVDGVLFDVMGFTGLSHDHLDYHGTMDAYFAAKAELFDSDRAAVGVVMVDDAWGERLRDRAGIPVITTTTRSDVEADWRARRSGATVRIEGPESAELTLPIPTDFAVANSILTIAMAASRGVPAQKSADAIAAARVPGRMEVVDSVEGIDFVVDYAHSPDSIEKVVNSAVAQRADGPGRVIVVLGAGGDRDRQKRPAMGRAASNGDVVVVTDDNPRSEDPASIRDTVRRGVDVGSAQVHEISPREKAIEWAVEIAQAGDVVLVLGKGHEAFQELADGVVPFDDRLVLASFVRRRFHHDGGGQGENT